MTVEAIAIEIPMGQRLDEMDRFWAGCKYRTGEFRILLGDAFLNAEAAQSAAQEMLDANFAAAASQSRQDDLERVLRPSGEEVAT